MAITSATAWAEALDADLASGRHAQGRGVPVTAAYQVSEARANGSILGVSIDDGADDDDGRRLVSSDGRWAVIYNQARGSWEGEDRAPAPTVRTPICTVGYFSGKWYVYEGVDIDGVETGQGDTLGPAFATYEEATTYARGLATREYRLAPTGEE